MVTYRCNLHCRMCDLPLHASCQTQARIAEWDTPKMLDIIHEFAALGVPGIGFTGGEPLLREDIFELLARTRQLGMITHLNTNGWLLGEEQARKIVSIGVDSVNISLDGATASTHDHIRQQPGSFDRAVAAVERLVHERKLRGAQVRVKTVTVLDASNIEEVPAMVALSRTLGTDCIEFIPRQPFANEKKADVLDSALMNRVEAAVDYLLHNMDDRVRLENSPAHLRLFASSFAGNPSPVRCRAGYNSLAVDCYGEVFPCVPWINWGKSIGNVRDKGLADFWFSEEYQRKRNSMASCRDCYLNCQLELNLLFDLQARFSSLIRR